MYFYIHGQIWSRFVFWHLSVTQTSVILWMSSMSSVPFCYTVLQCNCLFQLFEFKFFDFVLNFFLLFKVKQSKQGFCVWSCHLRNEKWSSFDQSTSINLLFVWEAYFCAAVIAKLVLFSIFKCLHKWWNNTDIAKNPRLEKLIKNTTKTLFNHSLFVFFFFANDFYFGVKMRSESLAWLD